MVNNGVRVEVVQQILGHADIRSTLIYARLKRETLKEAMKGFDVAGGYKPGTNED